MVGPAVSTSGSRGLGPISMPFTADPSVTWEVQFSEGPNGILLPELGNQGPVTQNVSVAPARTDGSAVLPSFTTHADYTMAFSCSGSGSLTIVLGGVAHTATALWREHGLVHALEPGARTVTLRIGRGFARSWMGDTARAGVRLNLGSGRAKHVQHQLEVSGKRQRSHFSGALHGAGPT